MPVCLLFGFACNKKNEPKAKAAFELLTSKTTGLDFSNTLKATDSFNMFNYMYFYNGAGVGAGDLNNDGLVDLFFASNQAQNSLFLNKGKLQFKEVTKQAGIPQDSSWSTGVSVVDINNDGLLDIYVCRVGHYENLASQNQLLVCTGIDKEGIPHYADSATAYGLNFSGFSTQAMFFDADVDGDLDMFLLNHSIHQNGTFGERKNFLGTYNELSGDRFYRNNNGKFTDETKTCGINSSAIGYGLGVCAGDIDLDGYPDIYIGNDFHENDYLYINKHDGTFSDELTQRIMHTSQFSMGVDVADANNDGFPEIVSMDMLPKDPYILKRSLGEDAYDIFQFKIRSGYNHQYARNCLQLNNTNGTFSETGVYSGVHATDWSWAPLWMDFDNDGLKDLFISNGIPKRLNDIDYVNYITNDDIQQKIRDHNLGEKEMAVVNSFPEIKLPNQFFRNSGNMKFEDVNSTVNGDVNTFSNGAVYADLDNDGDLDIVVNNINDPVMVYRNKANDDQSHPSFSLKLKGPQQNRNAIGTKLLIYKDSGQVSLYEKFPVRGFQSSMEIPLQAGLYHQRIDSAFIIWPDNGYEKLAVPVKDTVLALQYKKGLPLFDYASLRKNQLQWPVAENVTKQSGIQFIHEENQFIEFNREQLLPRMYSTEGPALAIGDVNRDGLEDVFIGAVRNKIPALFIQDKSGTFSLSRQPYLELDSTYEDVSACFTDVNNDSFPDLVIASGGNEFFGKDEHLLPRLYINDTKGGFYKQANAFDKIFSTASVVVPTDINGDGYNDLFIGSRAVPYAYGKMPESFLLLNNRNGSFTKTYLLPDSGRIGFVTNASWTDMDQDGDADLVVSKEWGGIDIYLNNKNGFTQKPVTENHGWWNCAIPFDADGDGDMDILAGNLGLNSRLKASPAEPVQMYYNDFDDNGQAEQVLSYYVSGREIPFANKDELQRQMPFLKKKFLYAGDLAKASLKEIFPEAKMKTALKYTATDMASCLFINDGDKGFRRMELPWHMQLTPLRDAAITDINKDGRPDIIPAMNYYDNNIQMGRYDAGYGSVLFNMGDGNFAFNLLAGYILKGQVRHIAPVQTPNGILFVAAKNNDTLQVLRIK